MKDVKCIDTCDVEGTMWGFILYTLAVCVGLLMVWCYEPREDEKMTSDREQTNVNCISSSRRRRRKGDFRLSSLFATLGLGANEVSHFEAFTERFHSFAEVSDACARAGLDGGCKLAIGVDFSASNEWQGRKSFAQCSLHRVSQASSRQQNPYQRVISVIGQTLQPFLGEENHVSAFGFGDSRTTDEAVFSFSNDPTMPCKGFEEVLDRYAEIARRVTLSGPTSFAPIIRKVIEMSISKKPLHYHILVIVADGQVTEEKATIDSIIAASRYPISIIVVGVGDGPWDLMDEFDRRLPGRVFDNFRFVDYHKVTYKARSPDTAFALQALMEIPDQYKKICSLGYLEEACNGTASSRSTPRRRPPCEQDTRPGSPISDFRKSDELFPVITELRSRSL